MNAVAINPTIEPVVAFKPDALDRYTDDDLERRLDEMVTVKFNLRRRDIEKLQAWMHSDDYEKAQALRQADLKACLESLKFCVDIALHHDYGTAIYTARFLASFYNGHRVQADVSALFNFDDLHFAHLMNALRLCHETHREPHSFFLDGNAIFEEIIKRHGLEKRRRKS